MDYDTFSAWLIPQVRKYLGSSPRASVDTMQVLMSYEDYTLLFNSCVKRLSMFDMYTATQAPESLKFYGVTVWPVYQVKDGEYKLYVEL